MSNLRDLDSAQSREIEEQLFATHRQQANRQVPVALPRQDFWDMVHQLLKTLDNEIQSMMMRGMTGIRLQNLQKRQGNIRLIASELARKRLVAMMQHVSSQSLRTATSPSLKQDLPPLDWQRHDPAEKAIYHMMQVQIDRFKMEIDWNSMQNGIASEGAPLLPKHAPGTVQLDSFVDQTLTGSPPPALAFEDDAPPSEQISDFDEEERMVEEEWPDLDEYLHADLAEGQPVAENPVNTESQEMGSGSQHAAAMELAPSTKPSTIEMFEMDAEPEEVVEDVEDELIRIRVLMSSPEPIATKDGEELMLEEGDVHFVDSETASWLIESGVAEAAPL